LGVPLGVLTGWRLGAGIGLVATLAVVVLLAAAPIGANTANRDSVTLGLGGPLVYHPLAPFMADLTPTKGTTAFLRLVVVVEAPQSAVGALKDHDVAITAAIQSQLRGFRRAEVVGSEGADRLRGELRAIINRTIAPAEVRTVYFTEILLD